MSTQYMVRVNKYGQYQVYMTTTGIDQRDVGPPFETPRGAITLRDDLQKQADEAAAQAATEWSDD